MNRTKVEDHLSLMSSLVQYLAESIEDAQDQLFEDDDEELNRRLDRVEEDAISLADEVTLFVRAKEGA